MHVPSVYESPDIAAGVALPSSLLKEPCGYYKSFQIWNFTPKPICVIDRSGLPIYIKSSWSSGRKSEVIVAEQYQSGPVGSVDPYRDYRNTQHTSRYHREMAEAIDNLNESQRKKKRIRDMNEFTGRKMFTVTHKLTEDTFQENGFSLYLYDVDLVIVYDTERVLTKHPHGGSHKSLDDKPTESFNFNMFIVDNTHVMSDKYTNYNNHVYRVPVVRNHNLRNGVYIDTDAQMVTQHSSGGDQRIITFEEAHEEFGLYHTIDDARNHGGSISIHDKELVELKRSAEKAKQQFEMDKLELDKELTKAKAAAEKAVQEAKLELAEQQRKLQSEKAAFDKEKAEFDKNKLALEKELEEAKRVRYVVEEELSRRKAVEVDILEKQKRQEDEDRRRREEKKEEERQKRKDHYEHKSHRRKDTSESLKIIPAVVGGVVAVAALLFRLFN